MKSEDFLTYKKRKTAQVKIGDLPMGSDHPVRLQSMTNTDTSDIQATADQIITITDAGAELVRITVPTSYVAEKIPEIKKALLEKGYNVPLVADIHFSPKAAEVSAHYLEKVRINPGNFADKKQFKHIDYTDKEYDEEVERLKKNFVPFLKICKENNTSIRIGTNHGSISDRILSRYGDTPLGMVESTMEFLRICMEENFHDVVISMKASNPIVMIAATRLLAKKMEEENMYFPIHLGVTEAGNETEGRIKSATGIGTLLADGIGDTIRVSLTESPEKEISVAKALIQIMNSEKLGKYKPLAKFLDPEFDIYSFQKRKSQPIGNIGGDNVPVVISDISEHVNKHVLLQSGLLYDEISKSFKYKDDSADYLYIGQNKFELKLPEEIKIISHDIDYKSDSYLFADVFQTEQTENEKLFININANDIYRLTKESFINLNRSIIVLNLDNTDSPVHAGRNFFFMLKEFEINNPVIFKQSYDQIDEYAIVKASAEIGSLFIDGYGDGIWISTKKDHLRKANELAFGILQACRRRITKTEYISCPSCGRTLFNLEETTAKIKKKTAHLKGLKIGIMGCIVNGPGEMADADFGYVGTGSGKITLYKEKDVIKRNIPEEHAVEELLKLIERYT